MHLRICVSACLCVSPLSDPPPAGKIRFTRRSRDPGPGDGQDGGPGVRGGREGSTGNGAPATAAGPLTARQRWQLHPRAAAGGGSGGGAGPGPGGLGWPGARPARRAGALHGAAAPSAPVRPGRVGSTHTRLCTGWAPEGGTGGDGAVPPANRPCSPPAQGGEGGGMAAGLRLPRAGSLWMAVSTCIL